MTMHTIVDSQVYSKPITAVLIQNAAVFTFGAIMVLAVGFMPMSAAHNAAHDTRHALAFPCH
ncbi:CbtB domain-containing protein [Marinagarivorans algicola]|uniref:CbtB domain-containing protein n=1 Tax=Marinagarivorans algicola TaxID=1513270 RepID=UPI0006B42752|nr:CbtB domain-containing protein [Marinagarivorans algicola]